ncbi:MAG: hypothetical protein ACLFTW_15645 [Chitinispirillaceae bacterium]
MAIVIANIENDCTLPNKTAIKALNLLKSPFGGFRGRVATVTVIQCRIRKKDSIATAIGRQASYIKPYLVIEH